jgi:hypothetical protein
MEKAELGGYVQQYVLGEKMSYGARQEKVKRQQHKNRKRRDRRVG